MFIIRGFSFLLMYGDADVYLSDSHIKDEKWICTSI